MRVVSAIHIADLNLQPEESAAYELPSPAADEGEQR